MWLVAACALAMVLFACSKTKDAVASSEPAATSPAEPASAPLDFGRAPTFNSDRAMQYTRDIVGFGPRPLGSTNHKKVEDYILAHLKGDDVEDDSFTIDSTEGKFPVRNIIAKYPGTKEGIIVIASHYDTNWPLRNINYVGANDGASSSGLLLELANQLRSKKRDGYSIWLLWDDAEESMRLPWYDPEALYGVRHVAQKWAADGTIKKIKAFLLEDMIGDADLDILRDENSTPWVVDLIYQSATHLGYQSHFFLQTTGMEDDHRPFMDLGVPSADIIDFTYGYNNVFWHTADDTLDKLSPKSLEIVGMVTLQTVQLLDQK
jgi:Zn-dependent M28 family amino/carboxypeptidase